ncbi:MAG: DUF308 domain-containing protein [Methanomicrobiales archaeon]|nr:DUF308 domain-containing protein [Methanomicrobiales archaeon]MDI6875985.1 DUF308 domain-containing protein [Methanomicrobiales archaeon]
MAADLASGGRGSSALRGIIAVIFGLVALIFPQAIVGFFAYFVGFLAIILSVFVIANGLGLGPDRESRWYIIVAGVLGFVVGILILLSPTTFIVALVYLIAIGLVLIGVGDLITGLTTAGAGTYRWLLVLVGIVSIVFAGILLFYPLLTTLLTVQIVGVYAIILGILDIIAALFRRRR